MLPVYAVRCSGEVEVESHVFLSSSGDGSGELYPDQCTTGDKPPGSHWKGGWMESTAGFGVFGEGRNQLPDNGNLLCRLASSLLTMSNELTLFSGNNPLALELDIYSSAHHLCKM